MDVASTPTLLDLKMCPQTSSAMNSLNKQKDYSPPRQFAPLRSGTQDFKRVQFADEQVDYEQRETEKRFESRKDDYRDSYSSHKNKFSQLRDRSNSGDRDNKIYTQLVPNNYPTSTYSSKTFTNKDQDSHRPEEYYNSAWKSKYARTFEKKNV